LNSPRVLPVVSFFVTYVSSGANAFEFAVVVALRTKQLMLGCVPRVPPALKMTSTAAIEVLGGHVSRVLEDSEDPSTRRAGFHGRDAARGPAVSLVKT
jgi:DNA-directed RNA polymerase subunit K/omega